VRGALEEVAVTDPISSRLFGAGGMPYAGSKALESAVATPLEHDQLAQAAIAPIERGMVVGLGTGQRSTRAIRALAQRVQREQLDIRCVATSLATEQLAKQLGLPLVAFDGVESVDYLFDGADEVDHDLRMMKGQHGAITRQRLVAQVAKHATYLTSEDKVVDHLGSKALLAVIIIPFGVASIRARLRNLGLSGVVRTNHEGEVLITDGGGVVLDMRLAGRDVEELASELDHVAGVVDHGLFLAEANQVLIESKGGQVVSRHAQ
jgi:ribose 5-phosphate isomerase A